MSDGELALGMSLPLDSEGFLRRECPTCEREFKWLPSDRDDDSSKAPDGGYFCPYCGIQAPPDSWFTQAQIELARNVVATEVVGPMLKDFTRKMSDIGRRSGGLLTVRASHKAPEKMEPLSEGEDMKRIDFACHPAEPVKVLEDWAQSVYCLVCGQRDR